MQVGTEAGFLSLRKAINILVMALKTATEATEVHIQILNKKINISGLAAKTGTIITEVNSDYAMS